MNTVNKIQILTLCLPFIFGIFSRDQGLSCASLVAKAGVRIESEH